MAHKLPPQIIDLLLLGAPERRRQLQDLSVLGDVWSSLAETPDSPPDLLIIPCWGHSTAEVARLLKAPGERHNRGRDDVSVAFIDGIIVSTLSLDDLIEHVIPATTWWRDIEREWKPKTDRRAASLAQWINAEIRNLLPRPKDITPDEVSRRRKEFAKDSPSEAAARLGALLGTFVAAQVEMKDHPDHTTPDWISFGPDPQRIFQEVVNFFEAERIARLGVGALQTIFKRYRELSQDDVDHRGSIFQVTTNRTAELALTESVPAIKADAARSLFTINCEKLGWAVVDSGIEHRHPAFRDQKQARQVIGDVAKRLGNAAVDPDDPDFKKEFEGKFRHRVRAAFDFTRIRAILGVKASEVSSLGDEIVAKNGIEKRDCTRRLKRIIEDRDNTRPVDWSNVEPLVRLDKSTAPSPEVVHGTHVAGIIGADWQVRNTVTGNFDVRLQGVCPDIGLYDFRVLGSDRGDSEFAVSAALQFIRYYNEAVGYQRIHGVNMSLAIRHNVRNYACGQTPVCKQAEALVANGVVVVAAAGNRGYLQYQLADQSVYEGYAASSITDPGNADGVITVGATHRSAPHTYGVSFFSSRGPTGDGRLKPDLLAPGEKITSCVGLDRDDAMDGTSMAAPHVSGAAALLMARHEELKGNARRIKEVLCGTATDLERERQFQGCGMVDVLRAIQSV